MADENLQQPTSKFYTSNKQGFRVTSGVTLTDGELKNETTDYTMYTDEGQGIGFYKNGLHRLVTNGCSYETVGVGQQQKQDQPAKIIAAATGNIVIEAQDGDILLKGRNIRFDAEDELTLRSTGIMNLEASTLHCKATNTNILVSQKLTMGGQFVKTMGGASNESGTKADSKKGSFLGRIFGFGDNPLN